MFKTIQLVILISLLGCSSRSVNGINHKELDNYLEFVAKKEKAMGETIILKKGKVFYQKAYGFKDQKMGSIFRIGSISKIFTAVMIMKEVERGNLSLETKLSKFFPQLPNAKLITMEHLLRHRSGLVNFTSLPNYLKIAPIKQTESSLIKMFVKNGVEFNPGKKHKYSNTGYVVLSLILEKLHKKPFDEILYHEIAAPLKLKDTYIYKRNEPREHELISYQYSGSWEKAINTHESVPMGAGAVASTANELARFLWSLFNENKILKQETVVKMKTLVDNYGLGIFSVPFNSSKGFGHTGGIDGFISIGFHFADLDTVVVNLTNALSMKMNDITIAILSSATGSGKDIKLPVEEKLISLSLEEKKIFEGTYKSKTFPLDIKIFVEGKELYAQATGQGKFILSPVSEDAFIFAPASIRINFNSAKNELQLTQSGQSFILKRKGSKR